MRMLVLSQTGQCERIVSLWLKWPSTSWGATSGVYRRALGIGERQTTPAIYYSLGTNMTASKIF